MKPRIFAVLLITVTNSLSVKACGWGEDDFEGDWYAFNLLDNDLYQQAFSYVNLDKVPEWGNGGQKVVDKDNLLQWQSYFGNYCSLDDMGTLIYKSSLSDLEKIREGLFDDSLNSVPRVFVFDWKAGKSIEALDYLIYAKQCQKVADFSGYSWYHEESINEQDVEERIELGIALLKSTQSDELRLRYGYQLVRLAHYSRKLNLALRLFNTYVSAFNKEHVIYQYAYEQLAGVYKKLGWRAKAAEMFSRVYAQCPSRRSVALRSFKFCLGYEGEMMILDSAINLAETPSGAAKIKSMYAILRGAFDKNVMLDIYQDDPQNGLIKWLMYVELHNLENQFLGISNFFNDRSSHEFPEQIKFIEQVLGENVRNDLEHFQFMKAYLFFLGRNYSHAKSELEKVRKTKELATSVVYLETAIDIAELETVDSKIESKFLKRFDDRRFDGSSEIRHFWMSSLHYHYGNLNKTAKQFLCFRSTSEFINAFDYEAMRAISVYLNKKRKKPIDRQLIGDENHLKAYLYECFGTYFFRKNQLDSAEYYYQRLVSETGSFFSVINNDINSSFWFQPPETFPPDIFYSRSDDWYDGVDGLSIIDESEFKGITGDLIRGCQNKLELVQHIKFLERKMDNSRDSSDKALCAYLLGNVWYNISGFGLYRRVLNNDAGWHAQYDSDFRSWNGQEFYYNDVFPASKYYGKILNMPFADDELKAKALFGLAKCMQAEKTKGLSHSSYGYGSQDYSRFNFETREFYELSERFSHTNYYKEALNECGYFRSFVNSGR